MDAPLILDSGDSLSTALRNKLMSLNVKKVWLLGGEATIKPALEIQLINAGYEITRLAGRNRYTTAIAVGNEIMETSDTDRVFLASGEKFPDALAVSAVAAKLNSPVLLTTSNKLLDEVKAFINEHTIQKVVVVGGTATVNDTVIQSLKELGCSVERVSGRDRYSTAVAIADWARNKTTIEGYGIASGTTWPDALSAGPLLAKNNYALLLTPYTMTDTTLVKINSSTPVKIFGGYASVSLSAQQRLERKTGFKSYTSENINLQQSYDLIACHYPIALGATANYGSTPNNYQAVTYYMSGRIIVNPSHTAGLKTILTHEMWHIIDWRDNGKIDWGENIPPR